jgi:hypothetical protein
MTAGQAQWVAAWRFSFLVLASCATLKQHASTTNPATLVWVAWRRCCGETLPLWVSTLDLHWSVTHCVRVRLFSPSVVATGLWWADPVRVRRAVGTRGQGAPTLSSVRRSPLDSGSSDAGRAPIAAVLRPRLSPNAPLAAGLELASRTAYGTKSLPRDLFAAAGRASPTLSQAFSTVNLGRQPGLAQG